MGHRKHRQALPFAFSAGVLALAGLVLGACASLTNDAYVPISLSFSDGSVGNCAVTNKRMHIETYIPATVMVRRSDDARKLTCRTVDDRTALVSIPSTIGAKIVASAVFLDLGITDSITDKHREYPASFVIPIVPRE